MAKYNRVSYSYTGYAKEAEAIEALEKLSDWFTMSHPDHNDWEVRASVSPTQYGYRVSLEAEKKVMTEDA